MNGVGHTDFTASCLDVLDGRPKRSARSKIEGKRDSRENALVVDGERGVGRLVVGEGAEWNKFAGLRGHINGFQRFRALLEFGSDFQHDVILIQAFVDVGDLALPEGITKSVVNVLDGDTKTAGGIAVNDYGTLQPMHLLVGVDVAKLRDFLQALHDDGRPVREVAEIVRLKRVLILCAAEASPYVEVLTSLQVQGSARNFGSLPPNARDDLINA